MIPSFLELEQLIKVPTHTRGNILDIILTDKPALISDLTVSDKNLPCKSDHFSVSFNRNLKSKRIKVPKREVYNYKRADSNALNSSLNSSDWDTELQRDVQVTWCSLFTFMDQHIPIIKIGGVSQPSWFDSEKRNDYIRNIKELWIL